METDLHTDGSSGDIPMESLSLNEHDEPDPRSRIEKLPTEILHNIFEHVGHIDDWDHAPDRKDRIRDIQNCRLTCSRLYDASSHLLCQTLQVSCNEESFQRLEGVPQHEIIRTGVQRIVVNLSRYDVWPVNHYKELFLYNCTNFLLSNIRLAREEFGKNRERLSKAHHLWAMWSRIHQGPTLRDDEDSNAEFLTHLPLLEEKHREYKRRYDEQEALTPTFPRAIASALAAMPHARNIMFTMHPPHRKTFVKTVLQSLVKDSRDVYDVAHEFILCLPDATTWTGSSPKEDWSVVVPDILAAIGQAGVKPKLIDILLDDCVFWGGMKEGLMKNSDEKIKEGISLAVEQLEEFNFHYKEEDMTWNEEMDGINGFLTCCLNSSSLQSFAVEIVPGKRRDVGWTEDSESDSDPDESHDENTRCHLGSVITSRVWPNLQRVYIGKSCLHLADLESFVRGLPKGSQQPRVIFHCVRLLSGTWAEALRTLREESTACVSFADMHCGGLEEWDGPAVFRDYGVKAETDDDSLAASYVNERGLDLRNPLYKEEPVSDWA